MRVTIRPVTDSDADPCVRLHVHNDQLRLIAPNSQSLEWARAHPECVPLAIRLGATLVGFAMYEPHGRHVFSVRCLMIDAAYQGRGIGRRALELVVDHIQLQGGRTIYLNMRPENTEARRFLTRSGFVEQSTESDGEVVFRYGAARAVAT